MDLDTLRPLPLTGLLVFLEQKTSRVKDRQYLGDLGLNQDLDLALALVTVLTLDTGPLREWKTGIIPVAYDPNEIIFLQ